jgi:hypothetical protein
MNLRNLGLRVSKPPADLVTKVRAASELAIPPPSPIDDNGEEHEVSMADSESVVSSERSALPADEPYWVADIELSVPPPANEPPPSPPSTSKDPEGDSSASQSSIESRLLLASFPLACSTILLVIYSLYGSASLGWLIFGGLAWSGIILSAGIILKTACDFVRKA